MFALVNTRWFFADQDYILAIHPCKMKPILYIRKDHYHMDKVNKILKACRMELAHEGVVNDNGDKYFMLKEAKDSGTESQGG